MKFRHLLGVNQLGEALFGKVGEVLQASGLKVGTGTIVDATIIEAPSSTKNADKQRGPDMHQTRKGKQWTFGMKMPIDVSKDTGLVHNAVVMADNIHDKHPLPDRLHGQEREVFGDCAYSGQRVLMASKAPDAHDLTNKRERKDSPPAGIERLVNRVKSKTCESRARVRSGQAVVGIQQGALPRIAEERNAFRSSHPAWRTSAWRESASWA